MYCKNLKAISYSILKPSNFPLFAALVLLTPSVCKTNGYETIMKQQRSEIAFHYKNISTICTETMDRNPLDRHHLHPPSSSYTFVSFHMITGSGNHVIPYTDVKRFGLAPKAKEVGANATVRRMGKASCTVFSHYPWQIFCGLKYSDKIEMGINGGRMG